MAATKTRATVATNRADTKARLMARMARWAQAYIAIAMVMSAGLNGFANAEFAKPELKTWAWLMGMTIPLLVLILSKVAGLLYKVRRPRVAYVAGAVAFTLLGLSVWHCASSIALLTGSNMALSMAFAVGIDVGLVICEISTLQAEQ